MAHSTHVKGRALNGYASWIVSDRGLGHEHFDSVSYSYWIEAEALSAGDIIFHLSKKRWLSEQDRKMLPVALNAALQYHHRTAGCARHVPSGCDDKSILTRHFPERKAAQ